MNLDKQNYKTFHTLNELATALSEAESTEYNSIIRSANLPISVFEDYCSWSSEGYTRNCIVDSDKFELILLCWENGQKTPIHDHGSEECWVKIIKGEFSETIYELNEFGKLKVVNSKKSKAGDITYMIDFMGFHSLENLSDKRSMSLHLYARPIRNCKMFDENSRKFVRKDLVYSTVSEFELS